MTARIIHPLSMGLSYYRRVPLILHMVNSLNCTIDRLRSRPRRRLCVATVLVNIHAAIYTINLVCRRALKTAFGKFGALTHQNGGRLGFQLRGTVVPLVGSFSGISEIVVADPTAPCQAFLDVLRSDVLDKTLSYRTISGRTAERSEGRSGQISSKECSARGILQGSGTIQGFAACPTSSMTFSASFVSGIAGH